MGSYSFLCLSLEFHEDMSYLLQPTGMLCLSNLHTRPFFLLCALLSLCFLFLPADSALAAAFRPSVCGIKIVLKSSLKL